MAEGAVGFLRHAGEVGVRDAAADEGLEHLDRHLGVRAAGEARDLIRRQRRPRLGHVKAAIAGQTREHHLDEIERGGLAPG